MICPKIIRKPIVNGLVKLLVAILFEFTAFMIAFSTVVIATAVYNPLRGQSIVISLAVTVLGTIAFLMITKWLVKLHSKIDSLHEAGSRVSRM